MANVQALLECSNLPSPARARLLTTLYAPLTFRPFSITPPESPSDVDLPSYLSATAASLTGLIAKSKGAGKSPLLKDENASNHLITFVSCLLRSSAVSASDDTQTTASLTKSLVAVLSLYCTVLLEKSSGSVRASISKLKKAVDFRVLKMLSSSTLKSSPVVASTLNDVASTGTGNYGAAMSLLSAMESSFGSSVVAASDKISPAFMKTYLTEKKPSNLLALSLYMSLTLVSSPSEDVDKLFNSFKMKFKSTPETALNCFHFLVWSTDDR